jgi:hypothetical protein
MKAQGTIGQYMLFVGSALLLSAGVSSTWAQNMSPLTGKLLQDPAARPAPAVSATAGAPTVIQSAAAASQAAAPVQQPETPASTGPENRIRVGDVTHALLQAQADGRVAGPRLPMLGATADASWARYMDSFKHPLPEFFENKVSKNTSN